MAIKQFDLGLRNRISFRDDTSDAEIIRSILIDRNEYALFQGCKPKIIYDVGAHIGSTSILLANAYPDALIFSFEPNPENFELLTKNTAAYENVRRFNFALGGKNEKRKLMASDNPLNTGGHSLFEAGSRTEDFVMVDVVDIREFMHDSDSQEIDLMKIDAEGAECEILYRLFHEKTLPQYIMGELHGNDDWMLLHLLSRTHQIKVNKELQQRCYLFYALRSAA